MPKKKGKPLSRESLAKGAIFGTWKKSRAKKREPCLYPSNPACSNDATAAHSIQSNGTLKDLAEDGHVYMIEGEPMFGYPPELPDFERCGRNQATTFKGLCNPHDTKLFLPIDTAPLDLSNEEHVFLLTYRLILKEVHTFEAAAERTDNAHEKLVAGGVLETDDKVQETMMSKLSNDVAPLLSEKRSIDRLYLKRGYGSVSHTVVALPARTPTLAVSGFFSAGRIGNRECWCALNVFPWNGRHLMVFSFKGHNELAVRERFVNPLGSVAGGQREHLASRVILENCANFVLPPRACETFGPDQRQAIRNYYWGTTTLEQARFLSTVSPIEGQELAAMVQDITGGLDDTDPRLNLFVAVD